MATYKGKDVQGVLEQFRATLEERDLIHPGDSIGTDDATLQCAGSPRQAVCRLYYLLTASVQTFPARTRVQRGQGARDVGALPGMAQDGGGRRHRRAVQATRPVRCMCLPFFKVGGADCAHHTRVSSIRRRKRCTSTAGLWRGIRYVDANP